MNVRDEILQRKPGQRITQMNREDFAETVRIFLIDKPDVEKLCVSAVKKDRTLARKICMIMSMESRDITALLVDKSWTRVEFVAARGGGVDVQALLCLAC